MRPNQIITPGTLYVIATPIGNLRDITLRALDVLAAVDVIAAEDTRTTAHLLTHYSIAKKTIALHQHNESTTAKKIVSLLSRGQAVAFVTDAGTPGISDPGAILVKLVREQGYKIIPIPGANAAVCALSVAGISTSHFLFYGFLPVTAGLRRRELENLKSYSHTLIFYEAPHRIMDCIADLAEVLGGHRKITIARELTKLFESIHICALGDSADWLLADPNRQRGEFVLLLSGAEARQQGELSDQAQRTLALLLKDLPLKQAVKLTAEISGESKNLLYSLALLLHDERNTKE